MVNRVRWGLRTRVAAVVIGVAMGASGLALASAGAVSATPRAADRKAPKVSITDMEFEGYNPVTISGKASDNVGVKKVRIRLRRGDTGKYFNGTGWQTKPASLKTKLGAAGATTTKWSTTLTLPNVYVFLEAQATDAAGNRSVAAQSQFQMADPPDLQFENLSTNPATLVQGSTGFGIVLVSNVGVAEYRRTAKVTVTVPQALTITGVTAGNGWSCTSAAHSLTCRFADRIPGSGNAGSFSFDFDVAADAPSSVRISAAITAALQINPKNDTKSIDVPVVPA